MESNQVYIDSGAKGILEDSYVYDSSKKIVLKSLSKKPNNIQNLIDFAYDESSTHIVMGCISINQLESKWYTNVTSLNLGNLYADTMLVVSF